MSQKIWYSIMSRQSKHVEISTPVEISARNFLGIITPWVGIFDLVIIFFISLKEISESAVDLGQRIRPTEVLGDRLFCDGLLWQIFQFFVTHDPRHPWKKTYEILASVIHFTVLFIWDIYIVFVRGVCHIVVLQGLTSNKPQFLNCLDLTFIWKSLIYQEIKFFVFASAQSFQ